MEENMKNNKFFAVLGGAIYKWIIWQICHLNLISNFHVFIFYFDLVKIIKLKLPEMDWKNKPNQIFNKVKLQMYGKGIENFYYVDQFIREFDPQNTGKLTPH